jgi:hypothetical protein
MWGIFCNILSVPHNTIINLNNVMMLKHDNVIISVSSEKIRHIEVNFYAVRSLKTLILLYIYIYIYIYPKTILDYFYYFYCYYSLCARIHEVNYVK